MKFQQGSAFENHLKTERNPSTYLVAIPSDFERQKTFRQILSSFKVTIPPGRYEGGTVCIPQMIDLLNTQSLFNGPSALILNDVDELKKGSLDLVLSYIEHPNPHSILVLGTGSGKCASDIYAKGKNKLVALDLTGEKPWERRARLQKYLIDSALKNKQSLNQETAVYILEQVGQDLSILHQEMAKLTLFTHGRSVICLEDVRAICIRQKHLQSWDLVDQIVWETAVVNVDPTLDLADLLPLIGQLRYQLQLGLQVALSVEKKMSSSDISSQFPQLRGAVLDKRISFAKQQGSSYFQQALHHLFKLELLSKNSSLKAPLLLDFFISKRAFYGTQKTHSIASSQCLG